MKLNDTPVDTVEDNKLNVLNVVEGETIPDNVLLNANAHLIELDSTVNKFRLSWLIKRPSAIDKNELSTFIYKTFSMASVSLEAEFDRNLMEENLFSGVLIKFDDFEIKFGVGNVENVIDTESLEGAGELTSQHNYKILLALFFLEQKFKEKYQTSLVSFCDNAGTILSGCDHKFDSMLPFIDALGFDHQAVRADAESLGLIKKKIDLSKLSISTVNLYF